MTNIILFFIFFLSLYLKIHRSVNIVAIKNTYYDLFRKTLIVEKGRPAQSGGGLALNLANQLLIGGPHKASVYSDFDVQRFGKADSRIILCEAQKSRLDVLVLGEENALLDTRTIKVKRRKNQKWIVQGPKLAVWDSEQVSATSIWLMICLFYLIEAFV